jgi:apolipoprotein N-acyltransferase
MQGVLAVISGVLLAFSLPPFNHEWTAWFALVPLLIAGLKRRPLEAVGLGMVAGITCGIMLGASSPSSHGFVFSAFPFLMLALLLGLGACAGMRARRSSEGLRWVLTVACVGLLLEWCTLLGPMPLHLALSQWRNLVLMPVVSYTGIWGVSLLIWLTNAALADALLLRRVFTPSLGLALALAGVCLAGPRLAPSPPVGASLRVAAIQSYAATEGEVFSRNGAPPTEAGDAEAMTRTAAAEGARLIVWPELGAAFSPELPEDPAAALAREVHAQIVVGYPEAGSPKGYNCAAVVDADGRVRGIHRKNYPFLGERRDTNAGKVATAFDTSLGRIGVAICFDTCYPELSRRLARAGAQLIAMPNYDPVTPRGLVHRLHGAVLPFRAAENRVPIVRCDSNGMSQVIAPTGQVLAEGPLFRPEVVSAAVPLGDGKGTFFSRSGDWVVYVCIAALLVLALSAGRRPSQEPEAAKAVPGHGE